MPHHRSRHHTQRPPHLRQRHHHRPQHRLHHIHPLQQPAHPPPPQHIQQRPIHKRRQRRTTLRHPLRKHRRRLQQLRTHPHPLRPLPRKHKHHTTNHPHPTPPDTTPAATPTASQPTQPPHGTRQHQTPPPPPDAPTPHARPPTTAPTSHHISTDPHPSRVTNAANRSACARNASPDRADTTHGTTPTHRTPRLQRDCGLAGGARQPPYRRSSGPSAPAPASRITWAFVPLIPNDDTPARRGRPVSGHGLCLGQQPHRAGRPVHVRRRRRPRAACWAARRAASPCTILMTPATPAAACVCPMFDLTEPSHSGRSPSRSWPYVASSACASIGSPSVGARAVRLHHVHVGRRQPRVGQRLPGSPAAARDRSARSDRSTHRPG